MHILTTIITINSFFSPNVYESVHPGLVATVCTKIWMWQLLYKLNDHSKWDQLHSCFCISKARYIFFHPDYFLSRRLVAIWRIMIICTEILAVEQHVSITEQQYSTQFYCIYYTGVLYRDFSDWEKPYCHVWDRQWAADTSFAPLAPRTKHHESLHQHHEWMTNYAVSIIETWIK